MLNQNFTEQQFSYLARQVDYWSYFKSASSDQSKILKKDHLQKIEDDLDVENYNFLPLTTFKLNGNQVYSVQKVDTAGTNKQRIISDDFILRKINQNLLRIYKIKQADRFQIISNVKALLYQPLPFHVCKLDIKSFYESVDRNKILNDLNESALLSFNTKTLLKRFFQTFPPTFSGLPRGINISAILSEYYMKGFDAYMRSQPQYYYYARFVDDIIIFSTEKIDNDEINSIGSRLPKGLQLNEEKSKIFNLADRDIQKNKIVYLGYEFEYEKKDGKKTVTTKIAEKKINKIKSRIISCFIDYKQNNNLPLLKDRLIFLTATYPLKTQRQKLSKYEAAGYLHGGIFYSYPLIDDLSCLKNLDTFFNQVLWAKKFTRISLPLTKAQKDSLKKYSFLQGYKRRISRKFSLEHLQRIIRCWN